MGRRQKRIVESIAIIATSSPGFHPRSRLSERTVRIPNLLACSTVFPLTRSAGAPGKVGSVNPHTTNSVGPRRGSSTAGCTTKRRTSSRAALCDARSKSRSARSSRKSTGCTTSTVGSPKCSATPAVWSRRAAEKRRRNRRRLLLLLPLPPLLPSLPLPLAPVIATGNRLCHG